MSALHRISRSYSVVTDAGRVSTPGDAVIAAILVGLGCYAGGVLDAATHIRAFGGAVLYPPYAVLLAGLLLTRPRHWWILIAGMAVAHQVAGTGTWPILRIALSDVVNVSRAILAAGLLRRFARRPLFSSLEGVGLFFGVAVLVAPAVAALMGAALVRAYDGGDYWLIWQAWFLSNALTALTLLPPLLIGLTSGPFWKSRPSLGRIIEATVLAVAMLSVGALAINGVGPRLMTPPERFVAPLPLLLWAAVRFGPAGTSLSLLFISSLAIASTMQGVGPFSAESTAGNLLSLHSFLGLVSVPLILLAALVRERERVTKALHTNQHRYRLATTAGGVAVWDWTRATNELYVDAPIHSVLGFAEGEIGNSVKSWQERLHPDDAARVSVQALCLLDGTIPSFETEYRMLHKDGSARWFFARGAVVLENDGSVRGLIGTQTDITDRKRVEESLRESEERTSLAANAANLGFWQRDLKTDVMWLSDHARRIYGLAPDVPVTRDTVYALKHVDDRDRIREVIQAAINARSSFEVEFRMPRPDGDTRWLNMQGRPRLDESGTATYLTGVLMDITERKQLALAAEEEHKELAHLGRVAMVGELSTALAHELNQPLTAILSNAQAAKRLLAMEPTDLPQIREILDDIVRDDARAAEVIRQLRVLIQKADALFQPLRVSELAGEALSIVRSELLTRGVSVTTNFPPSLPSVTGDRVQLLQVLLNLILNACDAMQDTSLIDRRLTLSAHTDDNENVIVSVADRGTGIAKGRLEKVFEPFVTTKSGGLGLGLAICRSIVNAHEGRLWAGNNPDHGAVFHLSLPTRPPTPQEPLYPKPRSAHHDVAGPLNQGESRF